MMPKAEFYGTTFNEYRKIAYDILDVVLWCFVEVCL